MTDPLDNGDRTPVMRSVEESIPVEATIESAKEFSSTNKPVTEVEVQESAASSSTDLIYGRAADPSIELYEERLVTQTRRVKTGEVKISKRVVTDSTSADIPVTKEKIIIEIESIYGGETRIDIGEAESAEDGSIRMGIYEEQALSCRRIVPYQNVSVRKEVVSDTVTAQEILRREEIDITTAGNPIVEER
ncbi:YsnF/AvaK domain-containing protein [cf. Phormidesmis sp. LEGE 11477]|uniref:YsnF/AvaK domain-containing protein n=1 Tax=cf. Phormidesmis sp. LEGE 11477 TaxID=1828680 RepID=UPI001880B449|nr:YsnF/AvaK domain-containing protein [cf. Phormidesmis sp. LEGE 11477]MBE9061699.1 YsnF/AvaK domain-containing protein [cf. Phormidesmis sp. LEGE 11477]